MGADLFESYAGSIVAPIILAALLFGGFASGNAGAITDYGRGSLLQATFVYPLLVAALGMVASIIGALLVRGRKGKSLSAQLHFGTNVAMVLTAIAAIAGAYWVFGGLDEVDNPLLLGLVIVVGLAAGYAIGFTSEYYTSDHYTPVKKLAGSPRPARPPSSSPASPTGCSPPSPRCC
jgi:K(+)-stimulated pyrophosphate-energized sodium pump